VKLGGVKLEDVRGMRAPFLETGGDEQYRMMADAGFEYDSSFMVGPHGSGGGAWPFTLDFAPTVPTYCTNLNCPRRPHPAVWQLPLNRWLGRFVIAFSITRKSRVITHIFSNNSLITVSQRQRINLMAGPYSCNSRPACGCWQHRVSIGHCNANSSSRRE